MANTTNFGWETPDDTDLVKDGAAAMRTLGNAIDTSLVDLKGGTTGQVLSKTSNTDMDFTWVTSDDANAIQNAIVDAKGDLIAASAADTPARLAVGSNNQVVMADSAQTTGLKYANEATATLTATGDLLYASAANTLARRAIGSTGDVLTVSGGIPTWAAPSGNTLISTTTLSGATTTLSSIPGTYKHLLLLVISATNLTADGYFTIDPNAAGNLGQSGRIEATNADAIVGDTDTGGKIKFNYGAVLKRTGGENAAVIWIYNYASSTLSKAFNGSFQYQSGADTGIRSGAIQGRIATTSAITSLVLANSGGNFDGGSALLYGVS